MARRIRKAKKGMVPIIITLIILAGIGIFIFIDRGIKNTLIAMSEAKVRYIATQAMNNSVEKILGSDINYTDLVNVLTDKEGNIAMIQANTVKMNLLGAQASSYAQQEITTLGDDGIDIPLGTVFGSNLLAGMGPNIKVKIIPMGSVSSDFATEFENAGINQTRHKIYLDMKTQVKVVVPLSSEVVYVSTRVPITETIIVGNVPDYYVNIDDKEKVLNLVPKAD
ncbi:MAG: sporulation protein YunB [Xylanivirga thermophila]|jgi:sporulation protein YunB|uniref:sporulation protein YunB n=1 Tax=Xylanivirga thermophila TaxID=2496273 RepID=UPI00101BC4E7|nr:sporulation protein YunB [Xylanivirga thermophila]